MEDFNTAYNQFIYREYGAYIIQNLIFITVFFTFIVGILFAALHRNTPKLQPSKGAQVPLAQNKK